jgi:hypothetical protein
VISSAGANGSGQVGHGKLSEVVELTARRCLRDSLAVRYATIPLTTRSPAQRFPSSPVVGVYTVADADENGQGEF